MMYICHYGAKFLQSCLILCDPMDHNPPSSSAHGTLQARILEWDAIFFSRDLPDPGIESAFVQIHRINNTKIVNNGLWVMTMQAHPWFKKKKKMCHLVNEVVDGGSSACVNGGWCIGNVYTFLSISILKLLLNHEVFFLNQEVYYNNHHYLPKNLLRREKELRISRFCVSRIVRYIQLYM